MRCLPAAVLSRSAEKVPKEAAQGGATCKSRLVITQSLEIGPAAASSVAITYKVVIESIYLAVYIAGCIPEFSVIGLSIKRVTVFVKEIVTASKCHCNHC